MGFKWRRPENIEFPIVWLEFQAKDLNSEDLVNYRVQDLPENRYEDALNIMVEHFLRDEIKCSSLELYDKPTAVKDFVAYLKTLLVQKIVVVCFREGSDEIVGLNFIGVKSSDDEHDSSEVVESSEWIKARKFMEHVYKNFNVFEHFGVDKYITSLGLLILPKFRYRGIAKQMLLAREHIGKKIGVKVTATIFTAIGSQKCSHATGFTLRYKISFEELSAIGIHFPVKNPKNHIEYSSLKFNF